MNRKTWLIVGCLFGLVVIIGTVLGVKAQDGTPESGPVSTASEAAERAMGLAYAWGEYNPTLVHSERLSRDGYLAFIQSQGSWTNLDGLGDVWLVELAGKFSPNHGPLHHKPLVYDNMYVVLEAATGDVLSVGCRGPALTASPVPAP